MSSLIASANSSVSRSFSKQAIRCQRLQQVGDASHAPRCNLVIVRCPVSLPTLHRTSVCVFCVSCCLLQCFHFFSLQMDAALPVALKFRLMQLSFVFSTSSQ